MPSADRFFGDLRERARQAKAELLRGPHDHIDYDRLPRKQQTDTPGGSEPGPPPELPLIARFQGQWVVGRQGTGKTQLFQFMLSRDLDLVAAGKASIVVLDPTGAQKGRLIHNLITLKRFAPGGDLHGRLVYIDPTDRRYRLPINLLSLRVDLDDEDSVSSAIGSYLSIMGGLMGQPLTSFQEPVFRYAVQAALAFPNPTLATLRDIIRPKSTVHRHVLHKLHPDVRPYFEEMYDSEAPTRSRSEILNRLYTLTSDPVFRRIFGAAETRIDFAREINEPKVIIINAARDYLQSLTELYGRYFLALITQAGERRASMPLGSAIPCFIYIDECDEFVANDPNAAKILLKLRGMNMALILGNQVVSKITDKTVQESFLGTAIKFVNANRASALVLAEEMNCVAENGRIDPSPLIGRPPLNFAFHVTGRMQEPIGVQVPYGVLEAQPHMSADEFEQVRQEIRDRYYVPTRAEAREHPPPTPDQPHPESRAAETPRPAASQQPDPSKPKIAPATKAEPEQRPDTEGATGWG